MKNSYLKCYMNITISSIKCFQLNTELAVSLAGFTSSQAEQNSGPGIDV